MFVAIFYLMFGISNTPDFYCKLGEKADMPAQPSCGVPVRIRIPLPTGGRRFEFRRAENPNLSAYFHRKRNGHGPVKRFSNLINLYKVDLYLCPKDFKTPKTLLFHLISSSGIKKYQCKLSSKKDEPFKKEIKKSVAAKTEKNVKSTGSGNKSEDKNTVVLSSAMKPPVFPPKPVSPFLITLSWAALGMSILFFIIFTIAFILLYRKIAKLSKAVDEINEVRMTVEMPVRKSEKE